MERSGVKWSGINGLKLYLCLLSHTLSVYYISTLSYEARLIYARALYGNLKGYCLLFNRVPINRYTLEASSA